MLVNLFYFSIFSWIIYDYLISKFFKIKYCFSPKEYKKFIIQDEYYEKILKRVKNITRDGYTKKKVPKDLDSIVIGSGIGGLTCAALLSKVGKKVLVLEQHYMQDAHTFEDKGYEFDTEFIILEILKRERLFLI